MRQRSYKNVHKQEFTPKNPEKYIGGYPIIARSSWELSVFNQFDQHPYVLKWGSECIAIPYQYPGTKKIRKYYPDLLVHMQVNGKEVVEVIEIKPLRESVQELAKNANDKKALAVNIAKWQAAEKWCRKQGITFRVMTEADIYGDRYDPRKRKR